MTRLESLLGERRATVTERSRAADKTERAMLDADLARIDRLIGVETMRAALAATYGIDMAVAEACTYTVTRSSFSTRGERFAYVVTFPNGNSVSADAASRAAAEREMAELVAAYCTPSKAVA